MKKRYKTHFHHWHDHTRFGFLAHGFRVVLVYCRRAGWIEQLCPWQQESSGCSQSSGTKKWREKGIKTLFPSGRCGSLKSPQSSKLHQSLVWLNIQSMRLQMVTWDSNHHSEDITVSHYCDLDRVPDTCSSHDTATYMTAIIFKS